MMDYGVLGFAFGLLIVSLNYSWYIALLMSIFIYARALQFLAIRFFSTKLGLVDIFIASIFVNFSFYKLLFPRLNLYNISLNISQVCKF